MNAHETSHRWRQYIKPHLEKSPSYYKPIFDKLHRLHFSKGKPKHGKHRKGAVEDLACFYCYTLKHFNRSLLQPFLQTLQQPPPAEIQPTATETRPPATTSHQPQPNQAPQQRNQAQLKLF